MNRHERRSLARNKKRKVQKHRTPNQIIDDTLYTVQLVNNLMKKNIDVNKKVTNE